MCGIVGLLLRDEALYERLGALVAPMLGALDERGPDSAGVAIYRDGPDDRWRLSLRAEGAPDWQGLCEALARTTGAAVALSPLPPSATVTDVVTVETDAAPDVVIAALGRAAPAVHVLAWGRAVEVVKGTGRPSAVCDRYGVADRGGYLAVAHTRMATESAVTAEHSHPFAPAADLCMVHNGSFSNHASVRRRLEATGVRFETDNDSEVAARYLASHLAAGDSLDEAVRWLMKDLDGFFTLAVTTADELSVVRDAFACKPAVVAETSGYVAVASEYRALATLPAIETARVFEPQPEEVYTWTR
jgi:methylamine---glutamate N-methyltransferase subunit A